MESEPDINGSALLNVTITSEELGTILQRVKQKKSFGFDKIPNEVLKHTGLRELLLALLRYCFDSGLTTGSWMRSIITPSQKGANKVPCVPLNYRGISLLSCVQKIYSIILNKRLIHYVEYFDLLVDTLQIDMIVANITAPQLNATGCSSVLTPQGAHQFCSGQSIGSFGKVNLYNKQFTFPGHSDLLTILVTQCAPSSPDLSGLLPVPWTA